MDDEIDAREHRFKLVEHQKDTSRQWDLIAASVEAAIIKQYNLNRKEARAMRGRSQVKINSMDKDSLDIENVDTYMFEGAVSRVDWLK